MQPIAVFPDITKIADCEKMLMPAELKGCVT